MHLLPFIHYSNRHMIENFVYVQLYIFCPIRYEPPYVIEPDPKAGRRQELSVITLDHRVAKLCAKAVTIVVVDLVSIDRPALMRRLFNLALLPSSLRVSFS